MAFKSAHLVVLAILCFMQTARTGRLAYAACQASAALACGPYKYAVCQVASASSYLAFGPGWANWHVACQSVCATSADSNFAARYSAAEAGCAGVLPARPDYQPKHAKANARD